MQINPMCEEFRGGYYSTSEHKVGTWIDGKPLYEKTVNFGTLPDRTGKAVDHNIANLDKIVDMQAIAIKNDNTLFYVVVSTAIGSLYATATQVVINTSTSTSATLPTYNAYVTVRYTKTS